MNFKILFEKKIIVFYINLIRNIKLNFYTINFISKVINFVIFKLEHKLLLKMPK